MTPLSAKRLGASREVDRRKWRKAVVCLNVVFVCLFFLSLCWEPVFGSQSFAGRIGGVVIGVAFMASWLLLLIGVPWLVGIVGRPAVVGWALALLLLFSNAVFPK